jgi:hypothetical protein
MESILCEKFTPLWNGLLEAWISCEGIQECKIVIVIMCVGEEYPY